MLFTEKKGNKSGEENIKQRSEGALFMDGPQTILNGILVKFTYQWSKKKDDHV